MSQNKLDTAIAAYRAGNLIKAEKILLKLLRSQGRNEHVLYYLGVVYFQQKRDVLARDTLLDALTATPDSARCCSVLSLLYERNQEFKLALDFAERAHKSSPTDPIYLNNLGKIHLSLGELETAYSFLSQANVIEPNSQANSYNLALVCARLGRYNESIERFGRLVGSGDLAHQCHVNLAAIHSDNGTHEQAFLHLLESLRAYTKNLDSKVSELLETIARLIDIPVIYSDETQLLKYRSQIEFVLTRSETLLNSISKQNLQRAINAFIFLFLRLTNFYWGYQGFNDREVNERYVNLIRNCLARYKLSELELKSKKSADENSVIKNRKRTVFVSEYFGLHATKWIVDLFKQTKKQNDDFIFVVLNDWKDKSYVERLSEIGDVRFMSCTEQTFDSTFHELKALAPDRLVFPDVGMTASSRVLSAFRFAPVQMVHWAHPITTGSPAIDYFISSVEMEPLEYMDHYTEKPLLLPGIGLFLNQPDEIYSAPEDLVENTSQRFRIVTSQSLFKYHPADDEIYIRIARRIPDVEFNFIEHPTKEITDKFRARFEKRFVDAGLDPNLYIRILPRMKKSELLRLLNGVGIYLDCFRWSGGNTTLDAIEAAAAIYTLPGGYMRGRHTAGILMRMGIVEGVCATDQDLIERLARARSDSSYLIGYRKLIEDKRNLLWSEDTVHEVLHGFTDSVK